jgi:hypothetical protein
VLLGSVRSNLSLGFDSGSQNQTRFWSKLVPFFYVSRRRVNQFECFWVQFGSDLSLSFDSGSKNRTGFWSKLVPVLYVSRRRVNKIECWLRCSPAVDGDARCVRIRTAVALAAEGHRCDTCAWSLRPGTDVDQHNSGLLHRTLLDASARLTPEEFGRFRERVALDGPRKGRTRLKQVFKQALKAAPEVWLPFLHQCFLF